MAQGNRCQKIQMKKILFLMMLVLSAIMSFSCSKDSDDSSNAKKGTYKMVITQTGDIDDFTISTTLTGGNGLNNGIFDESGSDLGMTYKLTDIENKRSTYTYQTATDGVMMIFVQLATCKDLSKSMTTTVKVYFNGNLVDERSRTYKGEDTSPLNISWSQVKE